jgi:hypothetical protein
LQPKEALSLLSLLDLLVPVIDALAWGDLEPKEALAQAHALHSQFEAEDLRDVLCGTVDRKLAQRAVSRLRSIRRHTSAYVSIRQFVIVVPWIENSLSALSAVCEMSICGQRTPAYASIRQHTPAYASIRQHTPAYASIRQHTSAYVRIRTQPAANTLRRVVSVPVFLYQ